MAMKVAKINLPDGKTITDFFPEEILNDKKAIAAYFIKKGGYKASDFAEEERPSFDIGEAGRNFIPGLVDQAYKFAKAATHPLDTLGTLYNLATDRELQKREWQNYVNKYGTLPDILSTIQHKPAEALMDASIVGNAAGTGVNLAGRAIGLTGKLPRLASGIQTAGRVTQEVAASADPLNIMGNALGLAASLPGKHPTFAGDIYGNAARVPEEQAAFLLSRDVLPTRRGLRTLTGEREDLVRGVQDRIAPLTQTLPSLDTLDYLPELRRELATHNPYASRDLAEYDRALNQNLESFVLHMPDELNAQALQDIKTRGYRESYPGENPSVTERVGRQVARKAKETLEGWDPRIGELNRDLAPYEQTLPNFANVIQGVRRGSDPISQHTLVPSLVAFTTGTPAAMAASTGLSLGAWPISKAAFARYLHRKGQQRVAGFGEATPFSRNVRTPVFQAMQKIEDVRSQEAELEKARKRREAEKR